MQFKTNIVELLSNNTIEIPIIQRDYVQGNKRNKKVAERFVKDLFRGIIGDGLHLDFIYGKHVNDKFIPLDGQQRITTLYLFYYYFSMSSDNPNIDILNNLTYNTRISSSEFIRFLVNEFENIRDIFIKNNNKSPGAVIKNSMSYFNEWNYDPTVASMLNMLDMIHNEYSKYNDKTFTCDMLKKITFSNFYINKHGLSDELYVKMNARGKQLSRFENFKAKFINLLENNFTNILGLSMDDISYKIDNEWINYFFKERNITYNDETSKLVLSYDDMFMNLIHNIFVNDYLLRLKQTKSSEKEKYAKIYNDLNSKIDMFDFYDYDKLGCINEKSVQVLISFLEYLNINGKLNNRFNEIFIKVMLGKELERSERIKFIFLSEYIKKIYMYTLNNNISTLFIEENSNRVFLNIVDNTLYNKWEELLDAVEVINAYIDLNFNKKYDLNLEVLKNNNGFASYQIDEESEKLYIMRSSKNWEYIILESEKNIYFKSRLGILLNLSREKEIKYNINDFLYYYLILSNLFNKNPDYDLLNLLRRGLLSIKIGGKRYPIRESISGYYNDHFLKLNDRDYSFFRCFRYDDSRLYPFMKILFDKINITFEGIPRNELSIKEINNKMDVDIFEFEVMNVINNYIVDNNPINDRYYYIIQEKNLLDLFKDGYLNRYRDTYIMRYYEDEGQKEYSLLLNSRTTASYCIEYYSFVLYLKLRKKFGDKYFIYRDSVGRQKFSNLKSVEILDRNIFISHYSGWDVGYDELIDKYLIFIPRESLKTYLVCYKDGCNKYINYTDEIPFEDNKIYSLVEVFNDIYEVMNYVGVIRKRGNLIHE